EFTTEQFKTDTPGATILRQDVLEIGEMSVGMMAARYNFGQETDLTQQAIFRSRDSGLVYYILAMTCPVPRGTDWLEDPGVSAAVEAFKASIRSVEFLDQSKLKEDQDQRLYHTKELYTNLTKAKLTAVLQKEQWLRVIRDGKDVGYTYVTEEVAHDL